MTCLRELKVERLEALEVEMLLEEMIRVIPVHFHPIVADLMDHPPIWETSGQSQAPLELRNEAQV